MSKISNHIHKYMRVVLGGRKVICVDGVRRIVKSPGTEVFKCMIPGCPTFKMRELVIGNESICWKCNEKLILNMANTSVKKPLHTECKKRRIIEDEI